MDSKKIKSLGSILTAAIAAAGAFCFQYSHYHSQLEGEDDINYARQEERLRASLAVQARLPALGFDNLVANWAFLQFIQYYGDNAARDLVGYSLSDDYFELIVDRDPRFHEANLLLSSATSLFGGRPDRSVELLGRSLKALPPHTLGTYFTNTYRGVDQILFLGDMPGARRSYEAAAAVARGLPDRETGEILATRASNTAAFLATNPDGRTARAGAWAQILFRATDDATRQRAIEEIQALGGSFRRNPDGSISVVPPED